MFASKFIYTNKSELQTPWDPTDVSLVAWIDASDFSSYNTSGSTLTSVADFYI